MVPADYTYPAAVVLEVDGIEYVFVLEDQRMAEAFLDAPADMVHSMVQSFREAGKNPAEEAMMLSYRPKGGMN